MRIQQILLGFILMAIVLAGCTTRETADNISDQDSLQSLQQPGVTFTPITETGVSFNNRIPDCETKVNSGNLSGITSPTACFDYGENASFELSHGPVTILRNDTSDNQQSYIVRTNMTLTNTGFVPVEVTFATVELKDDISDGCFSGERFRCGVLVFGPLDKYQDHWLNPGKSETKTLNVTFISSKSIDYLSSQKFVLEGVFEVAWKLPDGNITGNTGERRNWMIDLSKAETR